MGACLVMFAVAQLECSILSVEGCYKNVVVRMLQVQAYLDDPRSSMGIVR